MILRLCLLLQILVSTPATAADIDTENPDREMIVALMMTQQQATEYSRVMTVQREAYLAVPPQQWQAQLAVYQETLRQLAPILNDAQIALFKAYTGCLLESEQEYMQLTQR